MSETCRHTTDWRHGSWRRVADRVSCRFCGRFFGYVRGNGKQKLKNEGYWDSKANQFVEPSGGEKDGYGN